MHFGIDGAQTRAKVEYAVYRWVNEMKPHEINAKISIQQLKELKLNAWQA